MIDKVAVAIVFLIIFIFTIIIYYDQNYYPYFTPNAHLQTI